MRKSSMKSWYDYWRVYKLGSKHVQTNDITQLRRVGNGCWTEVRLELPEAAKVAKHIRRHGCRQGVCWFFTISQKLCIGEYIIYIQYHTYIYSISIRIIYYTYYTYPIYIHYIHPMKILHASEASCKAQPAPLESWAPSQVTRACLCPVARPKARQRIDMGKAIDAAYACVYILVNVIWCNMM